MGKSGGRGGANVPQWQESRSGGGSAPLAGGGFRGNRAGSGSANRPGHHASRVILWGGLGGALLALLIVYIIPNAWPTPVVTLVFTGYDEFAPPNALAQEDDELLERLLTPRGGRARDFRVQRVARDSTAQGPRGNASIAELRHAFLAAIEESLEETHTDGGDTLIVYLSAHGAVVNERPVLLAPDFDPRQEAAGSGQFLYVSELLAELKDRVPAEVNKVVLLDANRAPFNWHLQAARFENAFCRKLKEAVEEVDCPNLYLINSAAPGQIGWAAPELGGSVFGYYVARGLAGMADVTEPEGTITLDELERYVRENVVRWVKDNRNADQEPVLLGLRETEDERVEVPSLEVAPASSGGDIRVQTPGGKTLPLDEYVQQRAHDALDAIEDHQEKLDECWRRHAALAPYGSTGSRADDLSNPPVYRRHPLKWARLELLLVRAEQYLFAGTAYQQKLQATLDDADYLLDELERVRDPIPPLSFPLADQAGSRDYTSDEQTIRDLAAESGSRGKLQQLVSGFGDATANSVPEPIERLFVRMLARHLPEGDQVAKLVPLALQARLAAERIAAPSDVRALPWSQHLLSDEWENKRRHYEDRLFVGTTESLAGLSADYEALVREYNDAAKLIENVSRVYAIRDEALQTLPLLARWYLMTAQIPPDDDQSGMVNQYRARLGRVGELWRDTIRISELLVEPRRDLRAKAPDLDEARQWVADVQDMLGRSLGAGGEVADEELKRRIALALHSPLMTGDVRQERRAEFLSGLRDAAKSPFVDIRSSASSDPAEFGAAHATLPYTDLLTEFSRQPGEGERSSDDLVAREQGERTAASMLACQASPSEQTPTLFNVRRYNQWVWHAKRALDDFWGPVPVAGEDTWSLPGADYYFERAAATYLAHADSLAERLQDHPVSLSSKPTADALRDAADDGIHVTVDAPYEGNGQFGGLRAQGDNPLLVRVAHALPDGPAALWVRPENDFKLLLRQQQGIGSGDYRTRLGLDISEARRNPGSSEYLKLRYEGPPYTEETKVAHVERLFRGHRWPTTTMRVGGLGPHHDVVWIRNEDQSPRITVRGNEQQVPHVVFVLDCSNSMNDPLRAPGEGGNVKRTRLEEAVIILKKILVEEGLEDNRYEVSIVLYGWNVGRKGGSDENRPGFRGQVPVYKDVHTLIPAQGANAWAVLNQATRTNIETELNKVRDAGGRGITPIYYALLQALESFRGLPSHFPKHIILITDGVDTQAEYAPANQLRVAGDVTKAVQQTFPDVSIHVLGLGLNANQLARGLRGLALQDVRHRIELLKDIANATGGRYLNTRDPTRLVEFLESLLQPPKYTVQPPGVPANVDTAKYLGDPWVVEGFPAQPEPRPDGTLPPLIERDYLVEVIDNGRPQSPVVLSGGEGLLLWYSRVANAGRRLEHRRYWAAGTVAPVIEDKAIGRLVNPAYNRNLDAQLPERCFIAPHKAQRNDDGSVTFRVSVQNDNEFQFSHRPRHVWAEIRPKLRNVPPSEWPVFPFYDLTFEQDTPVPVLMLTVPAEFAAKWREIEAEIKIWCSFEKDLDPAALEFEMLDKADELQSLGEVEALPHVFFEVKTQEGDGSNPFKVIVYERHLEQSPSLYSARVQIHPPPDAARHMYYVESDLVRHEFSFENPEIARFKQPKILVTPRAEIEDRAIVIDGVRQVDGRRIGPFEVRVP